MCSRCYYFFLYPSFKFILILIKSLAFELGTSRKHHMCEIVLQDQHVRETGHISLVFWNRILLRRRTSHRGCISTFCFANANSLRNKLIDLLMDLFMIYYGHIIWSIMFLVMFEKLTCSFMNTRFNHWHLIGFLLKCNVSVEKEVCPPWKEHLQLREMSSEMLVLQMVEYGNNFRKALTGCVLLFYSNFSTTWRNLFSDSSSAKNHCKNKKWSAKQTKLIRLSLALGISLGCSCFHI